jgi:hypothetical protein
LACVLDERDSFGGKKLHNFLARSGIPEQVNQNNRSGSLSDLWGDGLGAKAEVLRVNVGQHGPGTGQKYRVDGRYEAHRGCDDLVSWADIERLER